MAVSYTLRDPNAPIAVTPQERTAAQGLVNSRVVLTAASGRGADLVEEIRNLSTLQTFDNNRIVDDFCRSYGVTEDSGKKELRNLLNVLRQSDLVLDDPDAGQRRPVARV